ncbi:MAG: hypothetical protein Q9191_008296 [Dirinaria sp. TL-2023a]
MKPADNSTGNFYQGIPNGADDVADSISVVALLTEAGQVHVSSDSNSKFFNDQSETNAWAVDMGTGKQTFSLTRSGTTVLRGASLKDISAHCICGIYNFNAYVGSLPATQPDSLQSPDGFQGFSSGLSRGICQPTPSLGTASAVGTAPTGKETASNSSSNPPSNAPVSHSASQSSHPVTRTQSSAKYPATSQVVNATAPSSAIISASPLSTLASPPSKTTINPDTGGTKITALSQLYPTNCMRPSQI